MSGRIVMVDDEEDLIWTISRQMTRVRPEVVVEAFLDPVEALERIQQEPPDLLVTDVEMPKMNGIELLINARRVAPRLPILVITAFPTSEVRHQVMKRGLVSFLEKPFTFPAFLEVVDRTLGSKGGFSGAISLAMLPDLVQVYALSSSSGVLHIERGGEKGSIWFDKGHVVHAECGGLFGEKAFYALIAWQGGHFWMEKGVAAPEQTIADSWQSLLIEGCRLLDEETARTKASEENKAAARPSDWEGLERSLRDGLPGARVEVLPKGSDGPLGQAAAALVNLASETLGGRDRGVLELTGPFTGMAIFWDSAHGQLLAGGDVSARPALTRLRNAVASGARSLWP